MPNKPPKIKPPAISKSKPPSANKAAPRTAKSFSVETVDASGYGEKLIIYAPSGLGKTTLASMAPDPVFIDLDGSASHIRNPITGEPLRVVQGIEDFADLRDALNQSSLWPKGGTVVLDTATKVCEELAPAFVLATQTIKGQRVDSFRKFGWDGDRYVLDVMRALLTDLDSHVRNGRNVILLCQQGQGTVSNSEGADFQRDEPALQHRKDCSVLETYKQWANHVLRIGYADVNVLAEDGKRGKAALTSDTTRIIYTGGALHFAAKTRPINGYRLPEAISFEEADDNSLMQYLFEGARAE
jgi:hypothetical protein